MHVKVKELPKPLQDGLRSMGYAKQDVAVVAGTTYRLSHYSGQGLRAVTIGVNLSTGERKETWGSWGGANAFNPDNHVDLDTTARELPPNMAVIHGVTGHHTSASITMNPVNLNKLLPDAEPVTELERKALGACRFKSGYRSDEFDRLCLGQYGPDNSLVKGLVAKGLLKTNKAGAISLTTAGKNAIR